jgi:aminoglycoside phosphotransferase (APT) family kinase protein
MDQRIREGLGDYLSRVTGRAVTVSALSRPTATGFSADTMVLDIADLSAPPNTALPERLVVQAAPRGPALFAHYDLDRTFMVQRELAAFDVPIAPMRWLCDDTSWIGTPFYVMDFVDGRIPPDRPPYHVEGWLFDEPMASRAATWLGGVAAIAALHQVPVNRFGFLAEGDQSDPALQRVHRWREFGVELGADTEPTLLRALDELETTRPTPGALSVHWGDAKLGNMIFQGDTAAATLDWELCGLSVGEEDLAHWMAVDWMLSSGLGVERLAGLPSALDTVGLYESAIERRVEGIEWWFVFALVRMGLIFQRAATQSRLRRGGDGPLRPNVIVPHLGPLLDGTTWTSYARH